MAKTGVVGVSIPQCDYIRLWAFRGRMNQFNTIMNVFNTFFRVCVLCVLNKLADKNRFKAAAWGKGRFIHESGKWKTTVGAMAYMRCQN